MGISLYMRVTDHWHRLLREVVEFTSSEIFKNQMDMVQGKQLLVGLV